MIDPNIQDGLRSKYNPEGSDLRRAQLHSLDLLIFIDTICNRYNLKYWIDSGTLLGAARHRGFIPWDDDIDISMPREDALMLIKIMGSKIFNGHITLQTPQTDQYYVHSSWITLRDLNNEYLSDSNYNESKFKGLQIDIFMVDNESPYISRKFIAILNKYFVIMPLLKFKNKAIHKFSFMIFKLIDRLLIPFLRLFKFKSNTFSRSIGCDFYKPEFRRDIIFPLQKIYFENYEFSCPNKIREYLNIIYRDWETIPSAEKIQTHNVKFKFT